MPGGLVKVAVLGSVGKAVMIDTSVPSRVTALETAVRSLGTAAGARHSSLSGLQVGDDHPQYAMWQAAETIVGQWNFATEPDIEGVKLTEFIQDVVGGELVEDTASVKWTYSDVPATLEANVDIEWVEDLVGDMLLDTASVDLSYDDGAGTIQANLIFANPSGLVGMSAVNGSAGTPLRSDARHAIDPAITPTWTGKHIFQPAAGNTEFRGVANDFTAAYISSNVAGQGYGLFVQAGTSAADSALQVNNRASTFASFTLRGDGLASFGSGQPVRLLSDSQELQIGAGQDLRLYHDGTDSFVHNITGNLWLKVGSSLRVGRTGGSPFFGFYNSALSTRNGYIQWVDASDAYIANEVSGAHIHLQTATAAGVVVVDTGPFGIKDGIAEPATMTGYAQLYVDTADGDLKIKFGDGTVKLIVTD